MKTLVASLFAAGAVAVAAVTPALAKVGHPSGSAPDRFSHIHGADCADGHYLADTGLGLSRRLHGVAAGNSDRSSGDCGDGRCGAVCEHDAYGRHDAFCGDDCHGTRSDVRRHVHQDCSTGNCDHGVAGTAGPLDHDHRMIYDSVGRRALRHQSESVPLSRPASRHPSYRVPRPTATYHRSLGDPSQLFDPAGPESERRHTTPIGFGPSPAPPADRGLFRGEARNGSRSW